MKLSWQDNQRLRTEALDLYVRYLHQYAVLDGREEPVTLESFNPPYGNTIQISESSWHFQHQEFVQLIWEAGIGDDGGPAMLLAIFTRVEYTEVWEVDFIAYCFDTMWDRVWDRRLGFGNG